MYTNSFNSNPMIDRAKKILANGHHFSIEDKFILTQVRLICLFRKSISGWRRNKLDGAIRKREEKHGPEITLAPEDFHNLNRWIRDLDSAKLSNLLKRVNQKRKEIRSKK